MHFVDGAASNFSVTSNVVCDSRVDIIITPDKYSHSDFNVTLDIERLCNCGTADDFNNKLPSITLLG